MADKTTIAIEVEVEGVEPSIESIKDLKNAIKAAKDEQVKAAAAFGQGSEEYVKASKKLGELKDSMDDLNDSTQSLRGSGVESLSSSFGMLGEGFKNLDLDKIKTGFKGIGQAMSAVPLMLLVTGITMLAEKFGIFEMITDAVVQVLYAFTDAIGLTNKADEKAAAEMIENAENVQKAKEEQYNAEIKKAQAAGQSTKQLELDKLKSTEDSIAKQVKAMEDLQIKKGKLNDEEKKNYDELQINLLKASGDREAKEIANNKEKVDKINAYNTFSANVAEDLRVTKLSEREKEIDAIRKASAAKLKELNEKEVFDFNQSGKAIENQLRKNKETENQINEIAQIEINKINDKYNKEKLDANKKVKDDLIAYNRAADIENQRIDNADALTRANLKIAQNQDDINAKINLLKVQRDIELQNAELTSTGKKLIEQKYINDVEALEKAANDKQKEIYLKSLAEKNRDDLALQELNILQQGNELQDLINQLTLKKDIELQNENLTAHEKKLIQEKYLQDVDKLTSDAEKAKQDKIVKIAEDGLKAAQNLSDIYFLFKSQKAEKGSKQEMELAKKQFNVNKALQLGMATIDGFKAITSFLSTNPLTVLGVPNPGAIAGLIAVSTTTAATIAKIAASKFEGGASASGGGGTSAPTVPEIPAPPISTASNNTNQSTLFDESGQNLGFKPKQQINVTATVGVDEITSKSNRVSVLEQQSTF